MIPYKNSVTPATGAILPLSLVLPENFSDDRHGTAEGVTSSFGRAGEEENPSFLKGVSGGASLHPCQAGGMPKSVIVGLASSGAKFTPGNHGSDANEVFDVILRGERIPVYAEKILEEIDAVHGLGVRYFHWHARNPETREQSCDPYLYGALGSLLRSHFPGLALSYGASRNGPEIHRAIARSGEWSRLRHALLPRHAGGADFVTIQAAAELVIILDMVRQGYIRLLAGGGCEILKPLDHYVASRSPEETPLEVHSTKGGGNYGAIAAAEQMDVLARVIAGRTGMNLPQEVEWTQFDRSSALTQLLLTALRPRLGHTGRCNLTILFGFSPRLGFPLTYGEFRRVIRCARSMEQSIGFPRMHLTISVGAAILPQKALSLIQPLDIGFYRGVPVPPLERLVAYATQHDSGVDLIRFGLEDHPFLLDGRAVIRPATNVELVAYGIDMIAKHGGSVITDDIAIRHFVSTENRPCGDTAA